MLKIVGLVFGAATGLVVAAWLYGGSTRGPGFAPKEASLQKENLPQFKLSSAPAPTRAGEAPPPAATEETPPGEAPAPASAPAPVFNTGGNPNVDAGAGPNWGLGFGLGRTTNGMSNGK